VKEGRLKRGTDYLKEEGGGGSRGRSKSNAKIGGRRSWSGTRGVRLARSWRKKKKKMIHSSKTHNSGRGRKVTGDRSLGKNRTGREKRMFGIIVQSEDQGKAPKVPLERR